MLAYLLMAFEKVAAPGAVAPGEMVEIRRGEQRMVLCHAGGEVRALDGCCPHAGGPLAQGALHGTAIVCPWHAWEFDCRTGEHDFNPRVRLQIYPVEVRDDGIYVDCD